MPDCSTSLQSTANNHWQQGPTWWRWLGSPLRPNVEDLEFINKAILEPLTQSSNSPKNRDFPEEFATNFQVCILGVTPELATLNWPKPSLITAIDRSAAMIQSVWVGDRPHQRKAILGDWRSLPLADQSCHVVLGDGCLTLLDYPQGYQALFQELFRVLKPQGSLSLRCFLRPSDSEPVTQIFEDLRAGKIATFHGFKLRLAMALQSDLLQGVAVAEVWQYWQHYVPNPMQLFETLNWPKELESTIAMYQNSSAHYTFPTLEELRSVINPYFQAKACYYPRYDIGDRCPTLIFNPNS